MEHMPAGYVPSIDAVRMPRAWEMIVTANAAHNPVYPFSEYFWSWKASHDMLFAVLAEQMPPADVYHAVSTGYAGLAGVAARLRIGKPFLLTEHGLYHKEREMEIKRASFVRGYQRDMWIGIMAGFILLNCWGGFRQAMAHLRVAKMPRRAGFACPACKAAPWRWKMANY
jgi:hypothetical protein